MCRLEPSWPLSVGLGPVSCPGAWHRGVINAGPAPINLLMFTQAGQHGLMQLLPDTSSVPVEQAPPASHAASLSKGLRKVFPWNNCLQHEQEAIEGSVIADRELGRTTSSKRHGGQDQGLQLSPQGRRVTRAASTTALLRPPTKSVLASLRSSVPTTKLLWSRHSNSKL